MEYPFNIIWIFVVFNLFIAYGVGRCHGHDEAHRQSEITIEALRRRIHQLYDSEWWKGDGWEGDN